MDDIPQDKLELLRVALPKGLAAGDSGLAEFNSKSVQETSWPSFQSISNETKLYTGSPAVSEEIAQIVSAEKTRCALEVYKKSVGNNTQIWVEAGTVGGQLPSGFDPVDGKIIASGGSGDVWAEVSFDTTTGEIVEVVVTGGASTPTSSESVLYYTLGYYEYSGGNVLNISNYGCGSLNFLVCRKWFAASGPFYTATLTR